FYEMRFLRLAPALYLNLLVCALFLQIADLDPVKAFGDIAFLNNLTGNAINPVTWSLSYEMQYYIAAPFIFLLLRKRAAALVVAILIVFLMGLAVPPLKYAFTFLLGFGVNLLPKNSATLTWKKVALVVGVVGVHLGFRLPDVFGQFEIGVALAALFS